jgi:ATP-binding cassette, subfamily A (ABC1), member 3
LESDVSIGKIFGIFEKSKEKLFIASYSVKQATIEQIFNLFAENKIEIENPVAEDADLGLINNSPI